MADPLAPQRPFIAVLPFADQAIRADYFADGISDALITDHFKISQAIRHHGFCSASSSPLSSPTWPAISASATWSRASIQRRRGATHVDELMSTKTSDHLWVDQVSTIAWRTLPCRTKIATTSSRRWASTPTASRNRRRRPPTRQSRGLRLSSIADQRSADRLASALREALDFYARTVALDPDFAEAYTGRCSRRGRSVAQQFFGRCIQKHARARAAYRRRPGAAIEPGLLASLRCWPLRSWTTLSRRSGSARRAVALEREMSRRMSRLATSIVASHSAQQGEERCVAGFLSNRRSRSTPTTRRQSPASLQTYFYRVSLWMGKSRDRLRRQNTWSGRPSDRTRAGLRPTVRGEKRLPVPVAPL